MKYLLDADAVIDYLATQPGALALFPELLRDGAAVSAPSLIELLTGVYVAHDPQTAERDLSVFPRSVTMLHLTHRIIVRTARLRRDLLDRKLPIKHRAYDLITAATALVHGPTLVTSNTRDFADILNLALLSPRTGQTR